jgi:hypothetical protein
MASAVASPDAPFLLYLFKPVLSDDFLFGVSQDPARLIRGYQREYFPRGIEVTNILHHPRASDVERSIQAFLAARGALVYHHDTGLPSYTALAGNGDCHIRAAVQLALLAGAAAVTLPTVLLPTVLPTVLLPTVPTVRPPHREVLQQRQRQRQRQRPYDDSAAEDEMEGGDDGLPDLESCTASDDDAPGDAPGDAPYDAPYDAQIRDGFCGLAPDDDEGDEVGEVLPDALAAAAATLCTPDAAVYALSVLSEIRDVRHAGDGRWFSVDASVHPPVWTPVEGGDSAMMDAVAFDVRQEVLAHARRCRSPALLLLAKRLADRRFRADVVGDMGDLCFCNSTKHEARRGGRR